MSPFGSRKWLESRVAHPGFAGEPSILRRSKDQCNCHASTTLFCRLPQIDIHLFPYCRASFIPRSLSVGSLAPQQTVGVVTLLSDLMPTRASDIWGGTSLLLSLGNKDSTLKMVVERLMFFEACTDATIIHQ